VSQKHTVIDLGEDEFTVGRPHPMIDPSTRTERIDAEASDPSIAVMLVDVVLGLTGAIRIWRAFRVSAVK